MQAGHLEIEDGVGLDRRTIRLARVGHRLKRLVCIAEDGFFTIDALKWLSDQRASLIMLERSGKISLVTGPTSPSDARLRRAQALSHQNGTALEIMRELMRAKLDGQQHLVRNQLADTATADAIAKLQESLSAADKVSTVAGIEATAAAAYWSTWRELPINFPRQDITRVPEHWRTFGTRNSVLTGSPRLATNPTNAILNYCYALLECEASLAATACGLDAALGLLHVDTPARNSLSCDIMEAVRPSVDAWLLDWIMREPFRRSDFFEERNGNCRLLKNLTTKLSDTMSVWGRLVAPWAEYVARTLWTRARTNYTNSLPTRLTQRHRREAKGASPALVPKPPKPERVCRGCGKRIKPESTVCLACSIESSTERLIESAKIGRIAGHTQEALAKEGETQRRHALARSTWNSASQPSWLTPEFYSEKIQPLLHKIPASVIAKKLGVSRWYVGKIRQGYRPHPRHWQELANLANISGNQYSL